MDTSIQGGKEEVLAKATCSQSRCRKTRSTGVPEAKGGFQQGGQGLPLLVGPLTSVTPLHVWTQPHCVRTGTRVLGRVAGDLRSRKAQVLTASIGLGTQLTGICS